MKSNDWRHKNVAPYTPGNTKILYFFNCLLDGMHTRILAYAFVSKPCSEATDIGYILSGGSGCFNSANLLKNLWKKTGEIEIIREIKSLRIDILLINKKKEYIIGVLLPIIRSQQKYHIFICFDVFSAYYNTIICVSVL